jgi:hypothetical protein
VVCGGRVPATTGVLPCANHLRINMSPIAAGGGHIVIFQMQHGAHLVRGPWGARGQWQAAEVLVRVFWRCQGRATGTVLSSAHILLCSRLVWHPWQLCHSYAMAFTMLTPAERCSHQQAMKDHGAGMPSSVLCNSHPQCWDDIVHAPG